MVMFLIVALVVSTLLCLLLGWACYRLVRAQQWSSRQDVSLRRELMDESNAKSRFISDVLDVLNTDEGGISRRISENAEIADAIRRQSPELLRSCKGLAYWLDANDRFLATLYGVVAEGLDREHVRRVNDMRQGWQSDVFERIYEESAQSAPVASWRAA